MSSRDIAIVGLVGVMGYLALKLMRDSSGLLDSVSPPAGEGWFSVGYLDKLAKVESSNNPDAKARTSSASGLFQFTKSTWEALGGQWGSNPALPFGGLKPTILEQFQRAFDLTLENAAILAQFGIAPTDTMLYAAHFLGASAAGKVLKAPDNRHVTAIVSSSVIRANPFLATMTVADFKTWLQRKMG